MKKAVIMAGGFGTRLRPLTMTIPKPMVPLLNSPMMEHIVNLLKKHKINEIVSVLYFQPDVIKEYFDDGSKFGIDMKYVQAHADYGTAGAVKNAYKYLNERFIIISGDVLTDFDISAALEFHKKNKSMATILLTRVSTPLQYGIVITDKDGKIVRFLEKPSWGEVFSDTINTGIYILEPEVLDLIPYQEEFDFSKDLFPLMLRKKMPLFGYVADGYWRDIGNLNEYQQGQFDALKGNINLAVRGTKSENVIAGSQTKIAPTAKFSGTVVIGKNSVIGEHAIIIDSVIGDNVIIGMGAKLSGVTIWDNVNIGAFADLADDVICSDCSIGASAEIHENVFISVGCTIGNKVKLMPNIKLWPLKHVEDGATLTRSLIQEEKWQRELFTDARISGLSNIEIHPEFGAKLGAAIGLTFGSNVMLVASRDPDRVSRIMKRSITAGIASVGVNVNDLQTTSIPQTRQELRTGKYAGGFHVRRSPRNPDLLDIIIFNKEGRDIPISRTKNIERYFFGEDIKRVHYSEIGQIFYPERTNEIYNTRFIGSLDCEIIRKRRFKILMDYSYGLASTIFPYILGNLRAETLSLHDYVDASRYMPISSLEHREGHEVAGIMRSLSYELGFVIEPGAEKIMLIDDKGTLYHPQRLLSIVLKLFLETNKHKEPYKIAVSVSATGEADEIVKGYNVELIRIKNSHSAMMEATREEQMLFVGGIWGGFIFTEFLFASDGMFTIGKLLEMLAQTNIKISELNESLPRRYQYIIDVPCAWEDKGTVMRHAMEHSESIRRQLIEGVKIFIGEDSVLLLPDKEKASFQVVAEGNNIESATVLAEKYSIYVAQWQYEN